MTGHVEAAVALDRQYSPSCCVPSLQFYLDEYSKLSAAARRHHEVRTGLSYGPHPDQTLDFFPVAMPGTPIQIFVHGGNWQELTKKSSAFAAPQFLLSGAAFAVVNYGFEFLVVHALLVLRWPLAAQCHSVR